MFELRGEKHDEHLFTAMAPFVKSNVEAKKGGMLFVEANTEDEARVVSLKMFTMLSEKSDADHKLNLEAVEIRPASAIEMIIAARTDSYVSQYRLDEVEAGHARMVAQSHGLKNEFEVVLDKSQEADDNVLDADLLM